MVHQRDSSERKKFITLMVLPHNSIKEVFRLNIPEWLAKTLLALGIILVTSIIGFFIYSATITGRVIHYYALKAENKIQADQIKSFYNKTQQLEDGIRELEERDQELREMLGLQKTKAKPIKLNSITVPVELKERMAALENYIGEKKIELSFLKEASVALVYKFDSYPSMSPAYGMIYSKMGWRIHPFTGRSEFHEGVDIPIWVGYPVRAAANGLVSHASWSSGYGEAVIIDHGNGYKTIYGHNQRLMVKKGEQVYKGQVIAKAGSTGLSTGPHVHYQVEYKNNVVNPEKFLDVNIRSARYAL